MKLSRRSFILSGLGALSLAGWQRQFKTGIFSQPKAIPGELLGANNQAGHRLRQGNFAAPGEILKKEVAIIGSGIAGLAAGYRLNKAGFRDFIILELENSPGGNAHSELNAISAYPWGAHYVPPLTEESHEVRELFEELGIITGYSTDGLPIYNDYFLCHDPKERLYRMGRWQDGLIPTTGITAEDEAQYRRFFGFTTGLKGKKGNDGKTLFAIPVDASSQDESWLALDRISMRQWLKNEAYSSAPLLWYIDYCCRDDFGTTLSDTSAWAGLHYFASRSGQAANTDADSVLTWPEGNGWLASALAKPLKAEIVSNALCYSVTETDTGVAVDYLDLSTQKSVRIQAKAVILATPRFIASRLLQSEKKPIRSDGFSYSPWAVANISLKRLPKGKGQPLSWDNVVYGSPFIGYVNAIQQIPQMASTATVLTYYWPLSHLSPEQARTEALKRPLTEWQALFLAELVRIHPELKGYIERIDLWLWGHGMIRPTPGFIWGQRRAALTQHPPIFTAHSDMSGISIFEEAYTRGVSIADETLMYLQNNS